MYDTGAMAPRWSASHPVAGTTPPVVVIRWMNVVEVRAPSAGPLVEVDLRSSHAIASAEGAEGGAGPGSDGGAAVHRHQVGRP